jgi:hypothetical protein
VAGGAGKRESTLDDHDMREVWSQTDLGTRTLSVTSKQSNTAPPAFSGRRPVRARHTMPRSEHLAPNSVRDPNFGGTYGFAVVLAHTSTHPRDHSHGVELSVPGGVFGVTALDKTRAPPLPNWVTRSVAGPQRQSRWGTGHEAQCIGQTSKVCSKEAYTMYWLVGCKTSEHSHLPQSQPGLGGVWCLSPKHVP